MDDWYQIKGESLVQYKRRSLLNQYGGSITKLVMGVYPYHKWLSWLFNLQHNKYLKSKEYFQWIDDIVRGWERVFFIKCPEQWLTVDFGKIERKTKFSCMLIKNHGLYGLLKIVYPFVEWDVLISKSSRVIRAQQVKLEE